MEHGHRINFEEAKTLGINAVEKHVNAVNKLVDTRRAQLALLRKLEWE